MFKKLFGKKAQTNTVEDNANEDSANIADEATLAADNAADQNIEPSTPATDLAVPEPSKKTWFKRLTQGLSKSNSNLVSGIGNIFTKKKLDDETLEALEDILIQADLGTQTAMKISEALAKTSYDKEIEPEQIRQLLNQEITQILTPVAKPLIIDTKIKPYIILMTGVNGAGKTTTIGKMAAKLQAEGKKVMLAAGDTFRAAAVEQLTIWGQRANVPVVTAPAGSDAASLAFEAIDQARAQNIDVLLIDTAGRLQNRSELMDELEKIVRVIKKQDATAPHATLLVLDATTGQNAVNQAQIFGDKINISGLVMTKLDGTAKGGILVAIAAKFKLPVHYIGIGETIDDLAPFDAKQFADALTQTNL
ncbi:MAG: signal recognition particle-docking protein FtsY [Rhizobiales bacterium]|nr:signal recognition particle-docking protein FtsY [Hyphomicrobiales bacterium]NRB14571.1 signal recognition particle-docking protein FtsY [Hyphomicrobiales bacterium]